MKPYASPAILILMPDDSQVRILPIVHRLGQQPLFSVPALHEHLPSATDLGADECINNVS